MQETISASPARYGQSCLECARAKCKCLIRSSGSSCVRCHRLKKDCRSSTSKRKRSGKDNLTLSQHARINETADRTARLEQQLAELVASLKNNGGSSVSSPALDSNSARTSEAEDAPGVPFQHDILLAHVSNEESQSRMRAAQKDLSWERIGMSSDEVERHLTAFRSYYSPLFPFVYILQSTAEGLRSQRPYLLLAILTISSQSISKQQRLGEMFRARVAEAMVVQSEKSLDLLCGLLVFIGWFHNQRAAGGTMKTALSMLTQLAISLVFDLHLNHPPGEDPHASLGTRFCVQSDRPHPPLTMDEIRAVLACFFVTSVISSYLHKTDALRWTIHMDEYLLRLQNNAECLGDEILVQLVRMQLVIEKMQVASWYESIFTQSERLRTPPLLGFQMSVAQLERIREELPLHLSQNNVVLAQLHSTELSIAEVALSNTPLESGQSINIARHKYLHVCLCSAKAWVENYKSFSMLEHMATPFSLATQSIRCIGTLIYLSTLSEAGWDKDFAKTQVDLIQFIDWVIGRLEEGIASIRPVCDDEIFTRHVKFWKSIRPSLLSKLEPAGYEPPALTVSDTSDALFDWELFENDWLATMRWLGTADLAAAL